MAKTLLDLASELEAKSKVVDKAASEHAAKVAIAIVSDLAHVTPVDTSRAQSNWIVSLGIPSWIDIDPHFPGFRGLEATRNAAETIRLAKAILERKQPGEPIYITNNVPYIRDLNSGSSKQEPAGFVERAVLVGRRLVDEFSIREK